MGATSLGSVWSMWLFSFGSLVLVGIGEVVGDEDGRDFCSSIDGSA